MENKILSTELTEAIHAVAELVKNDARHLAIVDASDKYSSDEEIVKLLDEYGAIQAALNAQYENESFDENVAKPLQDRMNEIYAKVTNSPVYVEFKEASDAYEELTNAIFSELEYAVTGHKHDESCTHDCSTCGGCH